VNFQPPTTFDTVTGAVSAALYLFVAVAVLVRAPTDARSRTFLTIAIASLAPYLVPAAMGRLGTGGVLTIAAMATAVSLAVGSVALFHFTQVFPSRRPWVRSHPLWLAAAYLALPLGAAIGAWSLLPLIRMMAETADASTGSGGLGAFSIGFEESLTMLLVLVPTIFVVGVVLPFAALLSLYKSWQEATQEGRDGARVTTLAILISQLAGGVLTILVVPLLHFVTAPGPLATIAAVMLFGFGLLFPIAFAIGAWKYRLVLQPD
jgi:hypothetical protein